MLADDLAVAVYEVSKAFPREGIYGITSKIRRTASSVAANIAEGASRESAKDYAHFLQIERGLLAETQYFLHLAKRLGYLDAERAGGVEALAKETFACLHRLIVAVRKESSANRSLLLSSLLVFWSVVPSLSRSESFTRCRVDPGIHRGAGGFGDTVGLRAGEFGA